MKCFACDRKLKPETGGWYFATTSDGQKVFVGRDCNKQIVAAGENGYQPPKGGPKIYKFGSKIWERHFGLRGDKEW